MDNNKITISILFSHKEKINLLENEKEVLHKKLLSMKINGFKDILLFFFSYLKKYLSLIPLLLYAMTFSINFALQGIDTYYEKDRVLNISVIAISLSIIIINNLIILFQKKFHFFPNISFIVLIVDIIIAVSVYEDNEELMFGFFAALILFSVFFSLILLKIRFISLFNKIKNTSEIPHLKKLIEDIDLKLNDLYAVYNKLLDNNLSMFNNKDKVENQESEL